MNRTNTDSQEKEGCPCGAAGYHDIDDCDRADLRRLRLAAKRVADEFKVVVDGAGNEYAQVPAEAMVGLEAALARLTT